MSSADENVLQAISQRYPNRWSVNYARALTGEKRVYVLHSQTSNEYLVVRNDVNDAMFEQVRVAGLGYMSVHSVLRDPNFGNLSSALAVFEDVQVLRYRPGKRVTLGARHRKEGPVIVKCVASGVEAIHARLQSLWKIRADLDFEVSEPLCVVPRANVFVQRRLPGRPLNISGRALAQSLARSMAEATASLHRSRAQFGNVFDCADQQTRSKRYIEQIGKRFPDLKAKVAVLDEQLCCRAQVANRHVAPFVPVHGSLHGHQWLLNGRSLALVDFDRASMGHAELDVATFLAQWDFEPGQVADIVKSTFLKAYAGAGGPPLNPQLLAYYRAHKHLSKAYKASKSTRLDESLVKVTRNLASAARWLETTDTSQ